MINSRVQFSGEAEKRGIKLSRFWSGQIRKYVSKCVGESEDGLRHPRQIEKVLIEREGAA